MIAPVDIFVGPNHLREVYPFPVLLNVEPLNPLDSRDDLRVVHQGVNPRLRPGTRCRSATAWREKNKS